MPVSPTSEQLRAQLQQLQSAHYPQGMGGTYSAMASSREQARRNDFQRQQMALWNRIEATRTNEVNEQAENKANTALGKIRDLTEGRADEIENDPYTASALQYLQGVTSGAETPFNDATQNAMRSRASDGSAAAMEAQSQALIDGATRHGGSADDPSVQAALRELNARRQTQNMSASQDINSQANIANFNARMGGASNLAAVRGSQNAQVNQMSLAGAGYRAQEFQDIPTGGGMSFASNTVTAPRRAPIPQPPPAPRPAPRPHTGMIVPPNQPGRNYMVGVGTPAPSRGGVVSRAAGMASAANSGLKALPGLYARAQQVYRGNTAITPNGRVQTGTPTRAQMASIWSR